MGSNGGKLDQTLETGFVLWHRTLSELRDRGLKSDSGSSALAVAVAASLVSEGMSTDQFLETLRMCLTLWKREERPTGPVLLFSCPLSPISGGELPAEELSDAPGN